MKKFSAMLLVTAMILLISCKKDQHKEPDNSPRTLLYEVTANFAGTIYTSYTIANGGTTANEIITLPWTKEITFSNKVTAAYIGFVGTGGGQGQKMTLLIKRGGTPVGKPFEIVADVIGGFSTALPATGF